MDLVNQILFLTINNRIVNFRILYFFKIKKNIKYCLE